MREKITYRIKRGRVSNAFEYIRYLPLRENRTIILSGCMLTYYYVNKDLKFLLDMKDKIDILLIGIGSKSYTRAEVDAVRKFLIKLRPRLLMARDLIAFSLYKDFAEHSFNGIYKKHVNIKVN